MAENGSEKGTSNKSGKIAPSGLESIAAAAKQSGGRTLPPVHLWNPPHCGDIGLRIGRDGTWYYQNSPIGRMALVKLFASVLRKDPNEYVLVTPVEKITIAVEDAPFVAVEMQLRPGRQTPTAQPENGQLLVFRTNVDDWVEAGPENEIRFEPGPSGGVKPYIRVRADLWALVSRPLFYDLVELGETRKIDGAEIFGVESGGVFFGIAPAEVTGSSVTQE
ncbi:MAG: DUF1285 domain-containing protein [Hyphomicrobiales bacterium]|nr:DUF1285 domain-containing protein [Hyphomicrobiales bacterium]